MYAHRGTMFHAKNIQVYYKGQEYALSYIFKAWNIGCKV